jgi:hypothetical protein
MSYKIIFLLFFSSCLSNVSPPEVELVKVPDYPDFYADNAMYGYDGKRIIFERSLGQGFNIAYLHEDSSSIVDIDGVSFAPTDISFDDSVLIGFTYLPEGYIVKYNFMEHKLIELTGPNTQNNKYGGGAAGLRPFIDSTGTLIYYTMITNRLLNLIGGIVQMNGSNWMEILRNENNRGPSRAKYNRQLNKILALDAINIDDKTQDIIVITYSNDFEKESEFNLYDILRNNKIRLSNPSEIDFYDSDQFIVLLGSNELYLINYKTQKSQAFIDLEQGHTVRELPKRHPKKENVFLITIGNGNNSSIFEYDLNTKIVTNIFARL